MSKANKPRSINKQTNKTRGQGNAMKSNIHSLGPMQSLVYSTELRLGISNTVEALVSDLLGNSRKWLKPELVAYKSELLYVRDRIMKR